MTNQMKRLDRLASEACRLSAPSGVCSLCCWRLGNETHHGFKRRIIRLRWDLRNLFWFCTECHQMVEAEPEWFHEIMQEKLGAQVYEEMRQASLKPNKGPDALDLDKLEADLKAQIFDLRKQGVTG